MKCPVCDRQVNNNGLHNHKVYRMPIKCVPKRAKRVGAMMGISTMHQKVMVHSKCNDAYLVIRRLLEVES